MTQTPHILFLAGWYPSRVHPTLGNYVQRHAHVLASFTQVTTLSWHPDPTRAAGTYLIEDRVVSERLTEKRLYYSTKMKWKSFLAGFIAVKKWYKTSGIELIHANILHDTAFELHQLLKVKSVPVVGSEHWSGYLPERNAHKSPWKFYWLKRVAPRFRYLLPVTAYLGHHMRHYFPNVPVHVWPNVVNPSTFYPGKKEDVPLVLHVSTLDPNKRVTEIMQAANQLWKEGLNFHLAVVGDGDLKPHQETATLLGLPKEKFTLLGEQPLNEIAAWMRKAHLFVLYSGYENFPCVIAEAWASNTPVLSSSLPGIAEAFAPEERDIWLADPNNTVDFVGKLRALVTQVPPFDGLERSKSYTPEYLAADYQNLLLTIQ